MSKSKKTKKGKTPVIFKQVSTLPKDMAPETLLEAHAAAKAHVPHRDDHRVHASYKLALKTEAARRGILPASSGDNQNFHTAQTELPTADVLPMKEHSSQRPVVAGRTTFYGAGAGAVAVGA